MFVTHVKPRSPNPRVKSSLLAKVLFRYLNDLFSKGSKRRLEVEDIFESLESETTSVLGYRLQREWMKQVEGISKTQRPSLMQAVVRTFWVPLARACIFGILSESLRILPAVMLGLLIETLSSSASDTDRRNSYIFASVMSLSFFLVALILNNTFFDVEKAGLDIRTALTSLVYSKMLRLNIAGKSNTTTSHVMNLVAVDSEKMLLFPRLFPFIIIAPIELIAYVCILWTYIGASSLVAAAIIVFLFSIQILMGTQFGRLRRRIAEFTDKRVQIMSAIIAGIGTLKIYTWELPFSAFINTLRSKEINQLKKSLDLRAINASLHITMVNVIILGAFAVYLSAGKTLTISLVFASVALTQACNLIFIVLYPHGIQEMMEAFAAAKHIQKFLELEETNASSHIQTTYRELDCTSSFSEEETFIKVENVSLDYDEDSRALEKISLTVDRDNPLLIITGPAGSGKSSIIMVILGEIAPTSGSISVQGTIGYVPQQPWIFSGTVRQNILFGLPFDKIKYEATILACALAQDIKEFPQVDNTLIGGKGFALTASQRSRIGLARAVYQDCDMYILDDPLAAVDTTIGKHLLEKCICGILKYKQKILTTNQMQYLNAATEIVCIYEGKTVAQGSYKDINNRGIDIASLLCHDEVHGKEWDKDSAIETEDIRLTHRYTYRFKNGKDTPIQRNTQRKSEKGSNRISCKSNMGISNPSFEAEEGLSFLEEHPFVDKMEEVKEHDRISEKIPTRLYLKYYRAGTSLVKLVCVGIFVFVFPVIPLLSNIWLAKWAEGEEREAARKGNETIDILFFVEDNRSANLQIFAGICLAALFLGITRAVVVFRLLLTSSKVLHDKIFTAVVNTSMYFFNTNSVGQILSVFSKDIFYMDEELIWATFDLLQYAMLTTVIFIVNIVNFPYVLFGAIPVSILFVLLKKYYVKTFKEMNRLEEIVRTPMYSQLAATIEGVTTIRSFGRQQDVTGEFNRCQDLKSASSFLLISINRWFGLRLDVLCSFLMAFVCFTPVVVREFTSVNSSIVGLSILYALNLNWMFQYCVKKGLQVGNLMPSVQRVLEYSKLEPESKSSTEIMISSVWPKYGVITGEGVSFSYHHSLPFVLKNLYFCIRSGEKVGIVGRPGSGKSSFIAMLLRMANIAGTIRIDGVSVAKLSLKDLRSRIAVIPQDPVIFNGSLRRNIDLAAEFHDADIWSALEEVKLKDAVMELKHGLSTELSMTGLNLSAGQRQLLCLVRAILRKTKILLIDEATTNVDLETDALIQETIREKFKECTVIRIAHRLNTVMDCDRIMVLQDGKIGEFDEPFQLLKNPDSILNHLVEQTGLTEANRLYMMAEVAFKLRRMISEQERLLSPLQDGWKKSKTRDEIIQMFGSRVIYESSL